MEQGVDRVSLRLGEHYAATFAKHGPSSEGVDWGRDESQCNLRYANMLSVINQRHSSPCTLLDVGCGYGGLLHYALGQGIALDYTGIDLAENMVNHAQLTHPNAKFLHADILKENFSETYDYVVCNGILTQKLEVPATTMDAFANILVRKLFSICRIGVAFNIMTTKVNFFSNNLYYRNPAEVLSWALTELTSRVRIDHSYPLYEYTVYLYKEHATKEGNP